MAARLRVVGSAAFHEASAASWIARACRNCGAPNPDRRPACGTCGTASIIEDNGIVATLSPGRFARARRWLLRKLTAKFRG